jgi:1-acyl-sn-glycerol-3-phosphate acyltransferase
MKIVLLRIWSMVFYVSFVLFFLIIFPFHFVLLLFKRRWTHDLSHRLNMLWGMVIMYPTGIWPQPIGRKGIDRKRVYIFVPNHSSYLDIPICNVSIPQSFRFVGKAELNSLPLFGYMFKRLHIPVPRESAKGSYRSIAQAIEKLKSGRSVLIFPEGTIPDKRKVDLLRFKDGAFRMAIESGFPIVPMTIVGADRALLDDGKWLIRPTKVKVIFHDPIETVGMEMSQAGELKDRVFKLLMNTLKENGVLVEQRLKAAGTSTDSKE